MLSGVPCVLRAVTNSVGMRPDPPCARVPLTGHAVPQATQREDMFEKLQHDNEARWKEVGTIPAGNWEASTYRSQR